MAAMPEIELNVEDAAMLAIIRELRKAGWTVAVHNDYRLRGVPMTFWLWTHERTGRFVKGEGETDAQALAICAEFAWSKTETPDA